MAIKNKMSAFDKILARWQLYLLLVVPLVYIIAFAYIPMAGIQLAFKRFTINGGIWASPWIGFDNFTKFFNSYQFERVVGNTLKISFYSLLAGFPTAIVFSLMLNAMVSIRYKKFIQTVTYMPHFISVVVMVGILMQILNPRIGIFGIFYSALTGQEPPNLIGDPLAFDHLYVWSGIWQNLGFNSIIYIAALSNVDQQLHEAAIVDGAGRLKRVIYIDFPCLLPTAIILLIMNTGNIMNVGFEKVFLMQNDLNLRASEVISTYVYRVGIGASRMDFSYATAIGLFNSVINFVLINIVNFLSKKINEQSLW